MSRESPIDISDCALDNTSSSASSSSSSSVSSNSSKSLLSATDKMASSAPIPTSIPASAPASVPLKKPPPSASSSSSSEENSVNASVNKRKIVNPYLRKKPFVGGAEAARQAARKKARTSIKILTPMERQRLDEVLPLKMNPMERFCAALFRSSPEDFVQSDKDANQSLALWRTICRRVNLPVPDAPLLSCYDHDPEQHFFLRAALVLEEARFAVARPLAEKWSNNASRKASGGVSIVLKAQAVETNRSSGHTRIVFRKDSPFTREELFHLRSGTVLECQVRDGPRTIQSVILAVIFSSNREQVEAKREFSVTTFRQLPSDITQAEMVVRPIETLVTQLRSFEAMTMRPGKIPFLHMLLGVKAATHTRFDENGGTKSVKAKSITDYFEPVAATSKLPASLFRLPQLNATQDKAATSFLKSKPNTLSLIQGPPGTGKTTLLVSVIARYLMESGDSRRIMVCAPTNKAISVLATRFMDCFDEAKANFSVIMCGDADKLLADEKSANGQNGTNKLRSIFCYSWLQNVIEDYRRIRNHFLPGSKRRGTTIEQIHHEAKKLEKRIENGLYGLEEEYFKQAAKISNGLNKIQSGVGYDIAPVVSRFVKKLEELQKTQQDSVWKLLIANANVIFCTLASAGGLIFKNACKIDDLVVDEAAAATEPELCIPFHLQPKRLLCVGDPLQLPATVLSRRAIDLGLSRSLHERLMYHRDFDYDMLDVQYRMDPEISTFPSLRFYQSKIQDGPNVQDLAYRKAPAVLDGGPYIFVKTNGAEERALGGSYKNALEAKTVVQLVQQLRQRAPADSPGPWHSTDRVRIITFYQGQVGLIKRLLREKGLGDKVVVATVDSSQGCEADVVIVSFVRSPRKEGLDARVAAGFLTDDRRMNVALTRARYQLVCVGNVDEFSGIIGAETLNMLAQNAQKRRIVRPLNSQE